MSSHPEPVQARAERLLRSYEGITVVPRPGLGLLGSDEECAVVRDLLAELCRVTTALEEMTRLQSQSGRYVLGKVREWRERAEAAERDLAALREELDTRKTYAMGAEPFKQALRDAFEAGAIKQKLVSTDQRFVWHETKVGDGRWITIDDAFVAYLASRDGAQGAEDE